MAAEESAGRYAALTGSVNLLGRLLGEIIAVDGGEERLALVEKVRKLSRAARSGDDAARQSLLELLRNLDDAEPVPVARALSAATASIAS